MTHSPIRTFVRRVLSRTRRGKQLAAREREVSDLRSELQAEEQGVADARARVEALEEQLARAQANATTARERLDQQTRRASFRKLLLDHQRRLVALRSIDKDLRHPQRHLPFKLRNYRLAASHGIATPRVLGVWSKPGSIDLDGLPERFVLKADGGAGSKGVLPLQRIDDGRFESVDGAKQFNADEVRDLFNEQVAASKVSGPYFAEEFLVQPDGGSIPDDVKLYVCYGEVLQVLLRRVSEHGNLAGNTHRYLAADGADLGDVALGKKIDPLIPVPAGLPEMVRQAQLLSRAVGVPFCRVDFYQTAQGVVLGEITRAPGGNQRYRDDHDEAMGLTWEAAQWRLEMDHLAGRPFGVLHGTRPAPNHYPEPHPSTRPDAGAWTVRYDDHERWVGEL